MSMPFKPVKPRFGGLSEIGTGVWAAWTGGKPAADWKGLDDPNPKAIKPNQYRVNSVSSEAKARHYRVVGLDTKFKRSDDLPTFQKKVMKHL